MTTETNDPDRRTPAEYNQRSEEEQAEIKASLAETETTAPVEQAYVNDLAEWLTKQGEDPAVVAILRAAPKMLAALEGFSMLIGEGMIDELITVDPLIQGDVDAALELVRAAIAEARGQ